MPRPRGVCAPALSARRAKKSSMPSRTALPCGCRDQAARMGTAPMAVFAVRCCRRRGIGVHRLLERHSIQDASGRDPLACSRTHTPIPTTDFWQALRRNRPSSEGSERTRLAGKRPHDVPARPWPPAMAKPYAQQALRDRAGHGDPPHTVGNDHVALHPPFPSAANGNAHDTALRLPMHTAGTHRPSGRADRPGPTGQTVRHALRRGQRAQTRPVSWSAPTAAHSIQGAFLSGQVYGRVASSGVSGVSASCTGRFLSTHQALSALRNHQAP